MGENGYTDWNELDKGRINALHNRDAQKYFELCNKMGMDKEDIEDKILYGIEEEKHEGIFQKQRKNEERLEKVNSLEELCGVIKEGDIVEYPVEGTLSCEKGAFVQGVGILGMAKYTFFGRELEVDLSNYDDENDFRRNVFQDAMNYLKCLVSPFKASNEGDKITITKE